MEYKPDIVARTGLQMGNFFQNLPFVWKFVFPGIYLALQSLSFCSLYYKGHLNDLEIILFIMTFLAPAIVVIIGTFIPFIGQFTHIVAYFALGLFVYNAHLDIFDFLLIGLLGLWIIIFWMIVGCGLSDPIKRILDVLNRVSHGDLDARVILKTERKDELGLLAGLTNEMIQRLKKRFNEVVELKAKVEEEKTKAFYEEAAILKKNIDSLVALVEQLVARSEDVTKASVAQKQGAEEASDAMLKMNQAFINVTDRAAQASDKTVSASEKAKHGTKIVGETVKAIEDINDLFQRLKDDMLDLKNKTTGISQIMAVISEIAEQTNLLAINAAIEASHAGEAGRGFAVVANEVKKLAEKTMAATRDVGNAISEIVDGVERNVKEVSKVGLFVEEGTELARQSDGALQEIDGLVHEVTDQVGVIASTAQEQLNLTDRVTRVVDKIKSLSEATVTGMQETKSAVNGLVQLVDDLRVLIKNLEGSRLTGEHPLVAG